MRPVGSLWPRFRRQPWWVQVVTWLTVGILFWPALAALYAASRPPARRRRWWVFTAVASLAWAGVAVASTVPQPTRTEQAGRVADTSSTTVEPAARGASPATTTTTTTAPRGRPAGDGPAMLARLRVAPEGSRSGFDRDLFVHWVDTDHDGCDTRREVLIAESRTPARVEPGCAVAGEWFSAYDGASTTDASTFDIDHVVALAEAWDSGASGWDASHRRAFANDVDHAETLLAVTASTNRAKSDQDPAEWRPSRRQDWCRFATDWTSIKVTWDLSADQAEVSALRQLLATCDG